MAMHHRQTMQHTSTYTLIYRLFLGTSHEDGHS